jgi:hypothetical protein
VRFQIADGPIYRFDAVERLTLKDYLLLEHQSEGLGRRITSNELETWQNEFAKLKTDEERKAYPNGAWLLAITLWAARRTGGDDISFDEAISFPMKDLRILPDPGDNAPPADPTRARRGSARAAKPRPRAASTTSRSRTPSIPASS